MSANVLIASRRSIFLLASAALVPAAAAAIRLLPSPVLFHRLCGYGLATATLAGLVAAIAAWLRPDRLVLGDTSLAYVHAFGAKSLAWRDVAYFYAVSQQTPRGKFPDIIYYRARNVVGDRTADAAKDDKSAFPNRWDLSSDRLVALLNERCDLAAPKTRRSPRKRTS